MSYEKLLSPVNIGSLTLKNRVMMTAAEMNLGQIDGCPTERMMDYYEERAKGGVGLIITGITRVNDNDATSSFGQLAMSHDYHIAPMHEFVERIHKHGAKLGVQLHHAGRQGYASVVGVLPAVLPLAERAPQILEPMYKMTPMLLDIAEKGISQRVTAPSVVEKSYHVSSPMRALTTREVKGLVSDFVNAAVRCKKAGVDVVELHAAHGYLIQQFLSPNTNHRTDEYGGSFENRLRFLSEIIQGIRAECGRDYPLMVRLSVDEFYDRVGKPGKGYDITVGKQIAKRLEELGVDCIDVSSANYDTYNYWLEPTTFEPGWRAYLAKEIKSVVSIPVAAANFIRSPEQAERQLEDGTQDIIGSARSFICDPEWVKKVEEGRTEDIRRCIGCLHCIKSFTDHAGMEIYKGLSGECALNPAVGFEKETAELPHDGNGRKVLVIGAGPAGLKSAEQLAQRGFSVKVLEKYECAGGQVKTASSCIKRDKLYWCIEDLMTSVKKLGVEVNFGKEATVENILAENPYAVVIASGGVPVVPRSIAGSNLPNVFTAPEIILKQKKLKNKCVVVAGSGMTGLETTEILNEDGNSVTVIEMADEIAPGAWFQLVDDELSRIRNHGTKLLAGKRLMKITKECVYVEDTKTAELTEIPADYVVLSLGVRPETRLYNELKQQLDNVYLVGDASHGGTIANAVHNAWDCVKDIH